MANRLYSGLLAATTPASCLSNPSGFPWKQNPYQLSPFDDTYRLFKVKVKIVRYERVVNITTKWPTFQPKA
jgi:hypothetical protein